MEANVKLGRILGIPIGLHVSWFLIFVLVTWSLAAGYFPGEYPDLAPWSYWLLGAVTSVLFFTSVLLHELGHSVLAMRNGIPVRGISLFIFGGVAQIGREPRNAGAEFRIAIAGPLTSLALAALFGTVWVLDRPIAYLAAPSLWLARINLMLALFNLIPGFPLDGGRVLRAVVWQATNSFQRATQAATFSGQVVAAGFIGLGLFIMLSGNVFNGLWLVFIGWFLQNAAAASYAQWQQEQSLSGVKVAQIMVPDCPRVSGNATVKDMIEEHILPSGRRCFIVVDEMGRPSGIVGLRDVAAVPRERREQTLIRQAMVPWERLVRVNPDADVVEALRRMDDANVAQVPVVQDDDMVGMLSREQVLHYLRLRSELGM